MRIVVAGGAGFIGSHYVRGLLDGAYGDTEPACVTVIDKLTYAGVADNLPREHPRLAFITSDICDLRSLLEVLPHHDAVVNFAAETHVDRSIAGAAEFVGTNVAGTYALLEACRRTGVPRMVQVSTDEVYGSINVGAWTEDWSLAPNSPYAASKAGGDLIAHAYWRTHGVAVSVTRCSNNYGPHQHPEKLIPRFVTNLLTGRPVPLYGDGGNRREWLHVEDHCRGVHLVLRDGRPGETYHIGGGTELTNREITERLLALVGAGWDMISKVDDRKGHDRRYALDDSKIRTELGYRPRIDFDEGLRATVEWYRAHPEWWGSLMSQASVSSSA